MKYKLTERGQDVVDILCFLGLGLSFVVYFALLWIASEVLFR